MFSKPGAKVSVHLHPGVTWNGVPYFDTAEIWQNSSASADCAAREVSDEYDFLINLAHNLFENYEISLGDMLYFSRFLKSRPFDPIKLEAIAAVNGWRIGFQQITSQIIDLVAAWDQARISQDIPEKLLSYPYQISIPALAQAFQERIATNFRSRRFSSVIRETYAYPVFYALKRRHDLPFLRQLGVA